MKNESGYFKGREKRELFYQYWLPDSGTVKAYIVAIHDLGTHSDRMKIPAEYFTEKGYAIYSFDLRGHWRNEGDYPGHIDSMDHIQKDIILFMDILRRESGDKKIFLMGHSFGGLIVLIYAIHHPDLSSVIVSSPMLGLSKKMSFGKKITKKISAKLSPTKTLRYIIDQKYLTSDLQILRKYLADRRKLESISVKTIIEINKFMRWAIEHASDLRCPCLIMQAGNDKIVDSNLTKQFFNKIKNQEKSYKEYNGFLHDLLNERKRVQVYQDMYVWLEKHLKTEYKS